VGRCQALIGSVCCHIVSRAIPTGAKPLTEPFPIHIAAALNRILRLTGCLSKQVRTPDRKQISRCGMARGLDQSVAVGLGSMVGPSQVGARLIETLAGARYHPVWTMVASALLVAIGTLLLMADLSVVVLAIVLYGAGNGIGSIARGTVPLALFGPERYPVLMGRLALPLLVAMSVAPFIGGFLFQRGGAESTLALLLTMASLNTVLVAWLTVMALRRPAGRL
jgi:hypothetical protein